MQSIWQVTQHNNFSGGENRLLTPDFVAENQVIIANNCIIAPEGVLQTRKGKTSLNNSLGTGGIISVHRYAKENGTKYLIVQHGTTLYSAVWDGLSAISFGVIKTGLNVAKLRSSVWRDNIILTNGVNNPFRFDGTICTNLLGAPPTSKYIAVYGAKLWFVDTTNPNFLRWSNLEDFDTWDALNIIKVRDGDGDTITGLQPMNGGLIITKNDSVWTLYGTDKDDIRLTTSPIIEDVGCYAPDTLQPGFFQGKNGFYKFDLTQVVKMANTHDAVLDNMADTDKRGAVSAIASKDNRIIVNYQDQNDTTLNFEQNYGCVTSWNNLKIGCMCSSAVAGDSHEIIIGDATNGLVYLLNNEIDDAGIQISTQIWTAYRDMGSVRDKVFRIFKPEFEPLKNLTSGVTCYYDIDFNLLQGYKYGANNISAVMKWDNALWDANVWGPTGRYNEAFYMHGVRGQRVSFGIETKGRVKFLGYITKFREAGAI